MVCGRCHSPCDDLRKWWESLQAHGTRYGYHPNASKTHLVVKTEHAVRAREMFANTGINITTEGKRHLGAVIGSRSYTAYACACVKSTCAARAAQNERKRKGVKTSKNTNKKQQTNQNTRQDMVDTMKTQRLTCTKDNPVYLSSRW